MTGLAQRLDALLMAERRQEAKAILALHVPVDDAEQAYLEYFRITTSSPLDADPQARRELDVATHHLLALAERPGVPADVAARALRRVGFLHTARRLRDPADDALTASEQRGGMNDAAAAARVYFHLAFDERDRALEIARSASAQGDYLRLAHATLLCTVGDLDGALAQLDRVESEGHRLRAGDIRAAVHAARGDLEEELAAHDTTISGFPDAHDISVRHLRRAHVNAGLDRLTDAREDFEKAVATAQEEDREAIEEYVRRRLDALDVATETTRRARLQAFPSVVQRWNYCGPAVLELLDRVEAP